MTTSQTPLPPDPLGDFFESRGFKVVDCTPPPSKCTHFHCDLPEGHAPLPPVSLPNDELLEKIEAELWSLDSERGRYDEDPSIIRTPMRGRANRIMQLITADRVTYAAQCRREGADEVLDELIEWYETFPNKPFNWYGAVKALKVSRDFKKPFVFLTELAAKEKMKEETE